MENCPRRAFQQIDGPQVGQRPNRLPLWIFFQDLVLQNLTIGGMEQQVIVLPPLKFTNPSLEWQDPSVRFHGHKDYSNYCHAVTAEMLVKLSKVSAWTCHQKAMLGPRGFGKYHHVLYRHFTKGMP